MSAQKSKADPYLLLLGISPTEERTHYRLLDIPAFEPDINVIENGRNRRNAALRQIKDGDLLGDAERIKEEIAKAFRCLCIPESKNRYDTELQEHLDRREAENVSRQLKPDPGFGNDVREQQIQQFRAAVREVFADGIVEQSEKEHLQQLHLKLGVSSEEARGIFAEIAKETQAKETQARVQRELEQRRIESELKVKQQNETQARVQREVDELKQKRLLAETALRIQTEKNESALKRQNEARDLRAMPLKQTGKVQPSVIRELTSPSVPKTPPPIYPQQSLPQHPPEFTLYTRTAPQIPTVLATRLAKSWVDAPAFGIMVCSAIWIFVSGVSIASIATALPSEMENGQKIGTIIVLSIALLVNVYMFFGAVSMRRLGSLRWARWACGLSLVVHLGCMFLGPIFGTWGLIVLARKDVKHAFRR